MKGLNNEYLFKVLTDKGNKSINNVNIGDKLYEYGTGNLLEVKDLVKVSGPVHMIFYSDGRHGFYLQNQYIYNGNIMLLLDDIISNKASKSSHIIQYQIDFNSDKVVNPLFPDPYVAGALFAYADYENENISIPLYFKQSDEFWVNLTDEIIPADAIDKSDVPSIYFIYNGDLSETPITWDKLFPNYKFYAKDGDGYPIFPIEYERGSIKDRNKFIRGIFDMGYIKEIFPDGTVGIVGRNDKILKEIQKILWSIGVISIIKYDSLLYKMRGYEYKLELTGDYRMYPGLFNNINNIENTIMNETSTLYPYNNNSIDVYSSI